MNSKKTLTDTRGRREKGQALLEFALVVPVFLVLIFGIVDFGMGLRAWITVTNSAREAARLGAVRATCSDVTQRAVDTSNGLITPANVSVVNCEGAPGESVVVTVEYDYEYITPLGNFIETLSGGPLHMETRSEMRLE